MKTITDHYMRSERRAELRALLYHLILLGFFILQFSLVGAEIPPLNAECLSSEEVIPSLHGQNSWSYSDLDLLATEPACTGDADDDRWFQFTAMSPDDIILAESISSDLDLAIEIKSDCSGPSIGCFNNYGLGEIERAHLGGLVPGDSYYYRVYGTGTSDGSTQQIRTQVKTFIDGGLKDAHCWRYDYELQNSIYAQRNDLGELYPVMPVVVNGYSFRFENLVTGTFHYYQHPNLEPYMQLMNVGGLLYGGLYHVSARHRVQVQVNGVLLNLWSPWSTPCEIGLVEEIPTTQLQNSLCSPSQDLDFESWIGADPVAGASQYRFRFQGGGQTLVKSVNSYGFNLYELGTGPSGLQYGGIVYQVDVSVRVNGEWSEYGPLCAIPMVSQPGPTGLRSTSCNATYSFPAPNSILADNIYGATSYQFRFTPLDYLAPVIYELTNGLSLAFHNTQHQFQTGNYKVEVRAFAGGAWGDFVNSCQIFIDAGPIAAPDDMIPLNNEIRSQAHTELSYRLKQLNFRKEIVLVNDGMEEKVSLTILDLSGRIHFQLPEFYSRIGENSINLSALENGVYIIELVGLNGRWSSAFVH